MNSIIRKMKLLKENTYFKYFVSYLFLFTVLILGFFIIIKSQIIRQYRSQQIEHAHLQMDSFSEQLNNELLFLSQIDNSIIKNISKFSYLETTSTRYNIHKELNEYVSSSRLISFITFVPSNFDYIISTSSNVKRNGDTLLIGFQPGKELSFTPSSYLNANSGQLIYLNNADSEQLLYFPAQSSNKKYIFFYSLDINYIKQQMQNLTTSATPAIALIDTHKNAAASINASLLEQYWNSFDLENREYLSDSASIYVRTGIGNGFSIVSLTSTEFLNKQINKAFITTYITLLLLSLVGFSTIMISMRITFSPLRKLTNKLIHDPNPHKGYLAQIDAAFSSQSLENLQLINKLNNYRTFMQKELLDSLLCSQDTEETTYVTDIDQFFDSTSHKTIYIVKIASFQGPLYLNVIKDYLQEHIPGEQPCCVLTISQTNVRFLINFIGTSKNKNIQLMDLLHKIHEDYGYFCAMSNGTDSPLDIPALHKNVETACESWSKAPVVEFQFSTYTPQQFTYPYDKMNQLANYLNTNDFISTRQCLDELIEILDYSLINADSISNYYEQSILINLLMIISNNMGQSDIKFDSFNNLFFETLHFCRTYKYAEKRTEIITNMHKFIDFYESKLLAAQLSANQILEAMNECYMQPDFSITMLANQFHISTSRMSHLFKETLNENFSNYLWNMRLSKAKEMLQNSDMSIEKISISIGYYNDTSFHRKFKAETGMTPSQYRTHSKSLNKQ